MDISGYYLDGKTAQKREVTVWVEINGLRIHLGGEAQVWWPYAEVRLNQDAADPGQIRLEKGRSLPEILVVPRPPVFDALRRIFPKIPPPFQEPGVRLLRPTLAVVAALGAVGMILSLYLWGIPFLSTWAASRIPISWEEKLGRRVVEGLAPADLRCDDLSREPVLREVMEILSASLPERSYKFQIIVVDEPELNAFAAPGGTIVLYRGLLERIRSPEELAGVLAHEMQHILHRHATRIILGNVSFGMLFSLILGDSNSATGVGREGAVTLATLHYSRQYEEQADLEGIKLILAAGIDPKGMISFFEGIHKEDRKTVSVPAYFSTHPDLSGRIVRLKAIARENPLKTLRPLPPFELPDGEEICQ
jgi:beta-barrel assembly-enhancing protease